MKSKYFRNTMLALALGAASLGAHGAEHNSGKAPATYRPDVTFTLQTDIADGKLVFIGQNGSIKGKVNPDLKVPSGAVVQINLVNGDGAVHGRLGRGLAAAGLA